tara:strand:+ start:44596 stop:44970 length:375 start_codon:yes stop_codon:yes gene_type:complete
MKLKLFASYIIDYYVLRANGECLYMPRMNKSDTHHYVFVEPTDYVGMCLDLQGRRQPILRQRFALMLQDIAYVMETDTGRAYKTAEVPLWVFTVTQVRRCNFIDLQPFTHEPQARKLVRQHKLK